MMGPTCLSRGLICLLLVLCSPIALLAQRQQPRTGGQLPPPRYIPSHDYDTQNIKLELRFDWEHEQALGTETITLSPLVTDLRRVDLDAEIARLAPIIPVTELGRVERTILRSALFEVLYSAATPSGETIHDAVSLARTYAGDAARRLVNGVLGSVSRPSGSAASGRGAKDG